MGLVGLRADSWGQWRAWLREHAVDKRLRPWSDEEERGELEVVGRPLGGPSLLVWTAPAGPPIKAFSARATGSCARARRGGARSTPHPIAVGSWRGRRPADGRLPALKRRRLGDGLEILASDDVLPLYASADGGWLLRQSGKLREADPVRDCPAWLLEVFGARWAAG